MASIARSLARPALLLARRGPVLNPSSRSFSVSPFSYHPSPLKPTKEREPRPEEYPPVPEYSPDLLTPEERSMYDRMPPEEQEEFDAENRRLVEEFNDPDKRKKAFAELDRAAADIERETPVRFEEPRVRKGSRFWSEGEEDEFADVEDADDTPEDDEITSMAHAELEVHREVREYARIAAWDMPLLSSTVSPAAAMQLLTCHRTRPTLHPPARNSHPPLPLHNLHGRASPGRTQGRRRTLYQGPDPQVPQ